MKTYYLPLIVILISVAVGFMMFKPIPEIETFNPEFIADSFDFPIGKPNGEGYFNAQKFGENNHLGEDWNGVGGGNTDFGDPIFSIASGQVTFAKDIEGGWGKVIRVKHLYKGKYYESLYAHCSNLFVNKGDWIEKGYQIGNIGDCDGMYLAHLHLEIRDSLDMPIGGGYSKNEKGFIDPSNFINNN